MMRRFGNGAKGRALALLWAVLSLAACAHSGAAPVRYVGTPAPKPAALEPPAAAPRAKPAPFVVEVRKGDTLEGLARTHRAELASLVRANGLKDPGAIRPGQRLVVPSPRLHVVKTHETLSEIAAAHRLATADLARLNGLARPYKLKVGQPLKLPASPRAEETVKVAARRAPSGPAPRPAPRRAGETVPVPAAVAGVEKHPTIRLDWPLRGRIISAFGSKGNGLHNDGINIAAAEGTPVLAADRGTVVYHGNELRAYGNLVLIRHPGGLVTAYAHNRDLLVRKGDVVRRGQMIARSGATGSVTSPQLHFEVRDGTRAKNPLAYLDTGEIRISSR